MPPASIGVTVDTRIPDPGVWDAVVTRAGAPVFYRASVVESYGRHPLQPTIDVRYLTVTEDGEAAAVLPFYLVPARDPFGDSERRSTWAISHFWHCYDTRLPVSRTGRAAELTRAVWDAMAAQAADWGAEWFGFTNVAAGNGDGLAIPRGGARRIPRNPRYRIPLAGFRGFDDHLARLPAAVRQDARRQQRLAARAGVVGRVYRDPLPPAIVDAACRLLALTAEAYNPGYYDRSPMEHLLTHAGPQLRVLVLERDGHVFAASISFLDGQTWHNWAIGVEPELRREFSPYLVLLALSVDHAAGSGCRAMEMGRTNPEWKQRVGAKPVALVSWMGRTTEWRRAS
jgi:hypothetical protein